MITENKIRLYEKYNGFLEAYIFQNGDLPNKDFDLMDWSLIDELIGNSILLIGGKASDILQQRLTLFIEHNTKSGLVIHHLNELAKKKMSVL